MIALELAAVSKHYRGRAALRELNLAVPTGASVGLLGQNGAGKTTALRILLGLCSPTRGHARLCGRDPREPAARRGVGYLPERLALPPAHSALTFLRLHAALAGLSGSECEKAVWRSLELTGLRARARDPLGGFSKGLAQRVGFAQALLAEPQVLILDEPTSGLDPLGVRDAREWIGAARARGATVLVSSHVLSEIERTCEFIVILHEGAALKSGPLDALVVPGETLEDAFVRALEA